DEIEALIKTAEENSTLSRQQRAQLNAQIEDYLTTIYDIAANSTYDGRNLLAEDQTITVQAGSGTSSDNRINVDLYASSADDLAAGLSSIDLSDAAGVTDARTRIDEAQQALRDREISLAADGGSISIARDQNRISQVAGDNIVQAQLAANDASATDDVQARISENLQAYLGDIASQLANQTVTVGGFALPEPQPDPFLEQNDRPVFDPNAEDGTPYGTEFPGQSTDSTARPQPFRTTGFGGYDQIRVTNTVYPEWEQYNGLYLSEIAEKRGQSKFKTLCDLVRYSRGTAAVLMERYSNPGILNKMIAHPQSHYQTDAWAEREGINNPAIYGSIPRIFHLSRKHNLQTIEETVRKMTGAAAQRLGIEGRGLLREGYFADLVVFDENRIRDRQNEQGVPLPPEGIKRVIVNGKMMITPETAQQLLPEGEAMPGRFISV
ncbi:MAG: amidohydrolase family protein, partial [Spirochaetales bacterium]|nr:amidohydrolase family protein [Spirochaetales bacterium]